MTCLSRLTVHFGQGVVVLDVLHSIEHVVSWSTWPRQHQYRAQQCRDRRRGGVTPTTPGTVLCSNPPSCASHGPAIARNVLPCVREQGEERPGAVLEKFSDNVPPPIQPAPFYGLS
ncbi:hypothetical protein QF001_001644 [Paraburkholderia youngii]